MNRYNQVPQLILLKKEVCFLSKDILDYIQTIYKGLNVSFVTLSRF